MFSIGLSASPLISESTGLRDNQRKFVDKWLHSYYEQPTQSAIGSATVKLAKMLDAFQAKKSKYNTEEQWLKYIFYQVHRKFLKRYQKFSTISDLFDRGAYDCVSGTALYALICELLYIPYSIQETEYHVYLLTLVDGKKVMIESTDPLYGFVNDATVIQSLVKAYQEEGISENIRNIPPNSSVDWIQLAGLQYFNEAVQQYNNENFAEALVYLNKATNYYRSDRIVSFKKYILQITEVNTKAQASN